MWERIQYNPNINKNPSLLKSKMGFSSWRKAYKIQVGAEPNKSQVGVKPIKFKSA